MTLSEFSIQRPVFAWMLMTFLILFGAISFSRMGISELPDVDFPVVNVSVNLDGASPEVMELDVVDIVEDSFMTIQGVKALTSVSKNGSANITIDFDLGTDIDVAIQEVQTKLAQAQRRLPKDMDPPTIVKSNPEEQPIMWLSVSSNSLSFKDLNFITRNQLKDRFSRLSGVGEVLLGGYIEPNLRVSADIEKLSQYALTISDISQAVQLEHIEIPAGSVTANDKEFNLRTLGEANSLESFSRIRINARGGQPNFRPIELGQIAKIEEGLADIRRLGRSNQRPAIGLGIKKQRGSNAVAVAKIVRNEVENIKKSLPEGVAINVNFDSTRFIEEAVGELNFTLILSAILTALICLLFFGSWSSTLNIILAIPTSVVGTFIFLYFSGFTLNTFTLLGLSLAIGIVVDDAIMMFENIARYAEMGKSRLEASILGSREITFPALVATLAIVAIFLPVVFMEGAIGKFFFQFGWTMTVAVMLSLVEALTLTPMRCSQFLTIEHRKSSIGQAIDRGFKQLSFKYQNALEWSLNNRWKVLIGSLGFFALTLLLFQFINKEFLPAQDQSRFLIRVQTPVGSSLAFTDAKFKEIESYILSRPEVARYYASIGGFGGGEVNTGVIFVSMKSGSDRGIDPLSQRRLSQYEVMDLVRAKCKEIPDVKVFVQELSARGFSSSRGFPIEFTIRGPDVEKLISLSREMTDSMEKSGLMSDINTDMQTGQTEIIVLPNRIKAAERGVSMTSIGTVVNAIASGTLIGKYPKDGRRYDIRLKAIPEKTLETQEDYEKLISRLNVRNNRGELIPLSEVVDIKTRPSLLSITRKDRERAITVYANIKTGKSQTKALEFVQAESEKLPNPYRIVLSGSSEDFKQSMRSLLFALLMGIIIAYMILASQFNSYLDPVSVLMALPFSISGALIGLFITHQSLNIYSFIGLILLMGIVKKNSILLVEFSNKILHDEKVSAKDALLKACPIRLRPILMTSLATIAGALPAALALGPGAETRIPMAVTVIGGVLLSTALTLLVVPCVYSFFHRLKER